MDRGRLYVVSAPSGAGKTSLVKALMEIEPRIRFSVSYTTRKPRPNEIPGRDYHFVSMERFAEMVAHGEFLEHAQVYDNCYGTGVRAAEEALANGEQHRYGCSDSAQASGRRAGYRALVRIRLRGDQRPFRAGAR